MLKLHAVVKDTKHCSKHVVNNAGCWHCSADAIGWILREPALTSAFDSSEAENEPKVQAGGDGARIGGRGTRNGAGDENSGGNTDRFKPGQNVVCKVGLCEYEGGYSVTVVETGEFGYLRTTAKLRPHDELSAVFYGWSRVGNYNQHCTYPLFSVPNSELLKNAKLQKTTAFDFVDSSKLRELLGDHW